MSHPERQALRHQATAVLSALAAAAAGLAALITLAIGSAPLAASEAALCAYLAWQARRQRKLSGRWAVGARSEAVVRKVLAKLEKNPGYTVRHNLTWRGHGDIDHAVKTPGGLVIAIDTKTKTVTGAHVSKMPAQAKEAARQMRGRPGPPLICVLAGRNVQQDAGHAWIVSSDQLIATVRAIEGSG